MSRGSIRRTIYLRNSDVRVTRGLRGPDMQAGPTPEELDYRARARKLSPADLASEMDRLNVELEKSRAKLLELREARRDAEALPPGPNKRDAVRSVERAQAQELACRRRRGLWFSALERIQYRRDRGLPLDDSEAKS